MTKGRVQACPGASAALETSGREGRREGAGMEGKRLQGGEEKGKGEEEGKG